MENDGIQHLVQAAKDAAKNSYSPYSNFPVGASFEDYEGNIHKGCNVENLAFPSGMCAERSAVFKGVSEFGPKLKIKKMVIYTPTDKVTTPCGGCRQVINEFATPQTRVICVCDSEQKLDLNHKDFLPESPVIEKFQ